MTYDREVANNLLMFLWNASRDEFLWVIFGQTYDAMEQHRREYVAPYLHLRATDPARIWSKLDTEKQEKLIAAAMERYE